MQLSIGFVLRTHESNAYRHQTGDFRSCVVSWLTIQEPTCLHFVPYGQDICIHARLISFEGERLKTGDDLRLELTSDVYDTSMGVYMSAVLNGKRLTSLPKLAFVAKSRQDLSEATPYLGLVLDHTTQFTAQIL